MWRGGSVAPWLLARSAPGGCGTPSRVPYLDLVVAVDRAGALWLCGSVAPWLSGSVALWFCGSVALWLYGSVALWLRGSVALWLRLYTPHVN